MFGLNRNRKHIEVRQTMGRLVNRTGTKRSLNFEPKTEQREETRQARLLPLLFTPVLGTEEELINHLGPAVLQDLSGEGFAMLSYGIVETEMILAMITDTVEVALLHCEIRHCRHVGYGYYLRGIKVQEKLRWGPFTQLKRAVEEYNHAFEPSMLEEMIG